MNDILFGRIDFTRRMIESKSIDSVLLDCRAEIERLSRDNETLKALSAAYRESIKVLGKPVAWRFFNEAKDTMLGDTMLGDTCWTRWMTDKEDVEWIMHHFPDRKYECAYATPSVINIVEAMKVMMDGGFCYCNTFGCVSYRNGPKGLGFYNLEDYIISLRKLLDCTDTWREG